jgi:hypothetical protein
MKLAIMQPYFLPYIGYFQLLDAADEFITYDNIQYSKRGWIRRNRILVNGQASLFSLPLEKGSDYLDIVERRLADSFETAASRILRRIEGAYRRSPYFPAVMPVVERCFASPDRNLFTFIHASMLIVRSYLGISTPITVSSSLKTDRGLKGQERVIATCRERRAEHYLNPINGRSLYDRRAFAEAGIRLSFLQSAVIEYPQYGDDFVPSLSIVDVMMFNSVETIRRYLKSFTLV